LYDNEELQMSVQCLSIDKRGKVREVNLSNVLWSGIKKDKRDIIYVWKKQGIYIVGSLEGNAGSENKFEFPPPIDNLLFFGTIHIIRCKSLCKKIDKLKDNSGLQTITKNEWNKFIENKFGGFDNIEDDEECSSTDEDDSLGELSKTKQGYAKDGFVVDDEDSDYISEENCEYTDDEEEDCDEDDEDEYEDDEMLVVEDEDDDDDDEDDEDDEDEEDKNDELKEEEYV